MPRPRCDSFLYDPPVPDRSNLILVVAIVVAVAAFFIVMGAIGWGTPLVNTTVER